MPEKVIHENVRLGTWRQTALRVVSTIAVAIIVYRRLFHLSWSATAILTAVVLVGGALYWRLFRYKVPLLNSRRGRRLMQSGRMKVTVTCGACGWRGNFLEMTSRQGEGEVDYFCPSCGREVGHT